MRNIDDLQIESVFYNSTTNKSNFDLDSIIYDLNSRIAMTGKFAELKENDSWKYQGVTRAYFIEGGVTQLRIY